jgi:histidyl-tRNA synthetase
MIQKPPGIEDIFPDRIDKWNLVVNIARERFRAYNYREIIIPVLEYTDVFSRGLGSDTDVVSKEMFTFEDRGGRSLTLRPEGTASVVRAYVENGEYNRLSSAKFFYCGPMFRAERPQRGRLRQFNQFGAEFFGSDDPYHDYEIISLMDDISKRTGIGDYRLIINSIGCHECRVNYVKELKLYYSGLKDKLCDDCARRLEKNPLRLLDCKNEKCVPLKAGSPAITEFLCGGCLEHHGNLKKYMNDGGIAFVEDPQLVRGLDYYTRTTFEFVSGGAAQNAFAAGGRYDNLVEVFGGKPTPAVGFAAGIERMLLLLGEKDVAPSGLDVFIVHSGGEALKSAAAVSRELRSAGISADIDPSSKGFKSQFKKADRENSRLVIIIGEDEVKSGSCSVKNMETGDQEIVKLDRIIGYVSSAISQRHHSLNE